MTETEAPKALASEEGLENELETVNQNINSSDGAKGSLELHNPSPPPDSEGVTTGDAIGSTLFSERFVVKTLMKLTELIKEKTQDVGSLEDDEVQELSGDHENQLSQLWDMSADKDVVHFLLGLPTLDLIADAMTLSKVPRLTEIVSGIVGNMACVEEACKRLSEHNKLKHNALQLLDTSDPPTLNELFRFLFICVQNKLHSATWLSLLKEDENFLPHLTFVLASSTNVHLLTTVADFIDFVLDVSNDLHNIWTTTEFVDSILEAIRQIGMKNSKAVQGYLRILQVLSTSNAGKVSLNDHAVFVVKAVSSYLTYICDDDCLDVSGHETGLASSILLLHNLLLSSVEKATELFKSEQTLLPIYNLIQVLNNSLEFREDELKASAEDSKDVQEESEPRMLQEILQDSVVTLIEELLDSEKGSHFLLNDVEKLDDGRCQNIFTWIKMSPCGQRCYQQLIAKIEASGNHHLNEILCRVNKEVISGFLPKPNMAKDDNG